MVAGAELAGSLGMIVSRNDFLGFLVLLFPAKGLSDLPKSETPLNVDLVFLNIASVPFSALSNILEGDNRLKGLSP